MEVPELPPFILDKTPTGLIEVRRNPSHDSAILGSLTELYALMHTVRRNDALHGEGKQLGPRGEVETASQKVL